MKKIILSVVAVLVVVIGISVIVGYNNLVDMDENMSAKYSQIEVRLQERHDKIGQLVDAVTGLQEHAETVYAMITAARAAYASAIASGNIEDLIAADALEGTALTNLLAVVEDNPNVTATAGYLTLLDEISAMESALAVARRDYNTAVQEYNASVRKFPRVLYAGLFGFEKDIPYWKMNDGADEVPEVVFD